MIICGEMTGGWNNVIVHFKFNAGSPTLIAAWDPGVIAGEGNN